MANIYYCTQGEDNVCPKQNKCKRYIESKDKFTTTLFKESCTEENNYILYIEQEKTEE